MANFQHNNNRAYGRKENHMAIKQVYKSEKSEDGVLIVQEIYYNDNFRNYDVHVTVNGEVFSGRGCGDSREEASKVLSDLSDKAVGIMSAL